MAHRATGYGQFTNCHFANAPPKYPQDTEVTISNMDVYFVGCYFVHVNQTGINCISAAADTPVLPSWHPRSFYE